MRPKPLQLSQSHTPTCLRCETPANLLEVRLEQNHDDDGTTYQAIARYTYTYEGRPYQGDRVGIDTTADNIGNYHQRTVTELERRLRAEEPISCFVNPSSPDDSVLFRELRFEKIAFYMLFAVIFGGAGVVTNVAILRNVISNAATTADSGIGLAGTATGIISGNHIAIALAGDATTGVDADACGMIENYVVDTGDRQGVLDPAAT